jgi:putative ABC transport system substrate-binding protein
LLPEFESRLAALTQPRIKQLMERLAIRSGCQKALQRHSAAETSALLTSLADDDNQAIADRSPQENDTSRWLTTTRPKAILRGAMLVILAVLAAPSPASAEQDNPIAVFYPDIGEPYRSIFTEIISGIEDNTDAQVASIPVSSGTNISALKNSLNLQHTRVVIALGRQGMKTAEQLNNNVKVVVGGVLMVPENELNGQPVISLTPDPALLFARMKALMPSMKRVFVVYDPAFNSWLIALAETAAQSQGLELVAYKAQDMRNAVLFYQKIFSHADSRSDALWLPQDPTTVEDSSILPLVLQNSWNNNLAVFSSNFGYVQRGVLFSLYPDNTGLGKSLAGLAQEILVSGNYGKHGLMPLHDVKGAINSRTAKHLGINLNRTQSFNRIFPDQ